MVTLRSHKVYVGKPHDLPWAKEVTLTTRYDSIGARLVELEGSSRKNLSEPMRCDMVGLLDDAGDLVAEVDINDIGIVIAWPEVESLTIFDENLYEAFQRAS